MFFVRRDFPGLINLYDAIFAAGMRPIYAVDAMAVMYMVLVMSLGTVA